MANIRTLIKKNIDLLINAKFSSIVFIIGPLLLILIISISLSNTSLKNVPCGFYSSPDVKETISSKFISEAKEKSFNIINYNNLEQCKQAVISGEVNLCVNLKEDSLDSFNKTSTGYNYILDTYVDFSQQRIVWVMIGTVQWIAEDISDDMRQEGADEIKAKISNYESEINRLRNITKGIILDINSLNKSIYEVKENQKQIQEFAYTIKWQTYQVEKSLNAILYVVPMEQGDYIRYALNNLTSIREIADRINDPANPDSINQELILLEDMIIKLNHINDSANSVVSIIDKLEVDLNEVQESDLDKITTPISVKSYSVRDDFQGDVKEELEDLDYLFPNFVMFFILFSSIAYGSINIIRERSSNAYIRNISSKLNGFSLIFSNFFTTFLIIFFQFLLIFLVSSFFLNVDILGNIQNILIFLVASISIFIMIGVFLGYLFNSNESAIIGSILISLFFFMFSSLISPIETLPRIASKIVSLSPFSILEDALKRVLIFNSSFSMPYVEIAALVIFFVFTIILTSIFYKKSKEKEI